MITYVNTVFVSNTNNPAVIEASALNGAKDTIAENAGKFVFEKNNDGLFRIGLVKDGVLRVHGAKTETYANIVKWSNWIDKNYIKSATFMLADAYKKNIKLAKEDTVTIDFTGCDDNDLNEFARGNRRIVVRLTFKDMPTRFRKWTESYEYVTKPGDKAEQIAKAFAAMINDQYKRARVDAAADTGVLTLTAMPYDDDNSVDTINVANKVRFNANVYYTNPQAAGFASKNKYFPTGLTINKKEGYNDPMSAKNVRDREAQAMGYEGILNRGCCTWPIIKPAMTTDLSKKYDGITIEFETKYRAADDIQRHTKQSIEIYVPAAETPAETDIAALKAKFTEFEVNLKEIAHKAA
nr:MAG TPA: hypothetical protein [Bacteriophage sp.]